MKPMLGSRPQVPTMGQTWRFRAVIAHRLGLHFDDDKLPWLAELLQHHCAAVRQTDIDAGLHALDAARDLAPWHDLTSALTVGETFFFRHIEHFDVLRERALPERWQARQGRPLRILSAGCASGEEPYSIAMLLASVAPPDVPSARIDAMDLNAQAVRRALAGRYGAWSLRGMPPAMRHRWLKQDGTDHVLDADIRQSVQFSVCNLLEEGEQTFWAPASMDVVFCRNVLMYLEDDQVRAVLDRFSACMAPGAWLFLSPAESGMRALSSGFESCSSHGAFYLRRQPVAIQGWTTGAANEAVPLMPAAQLAVATSHGSPATARHPMPTPVGHTSPMQHEILSLLQQERHEAARQACQALRAAQPQTPPPWLPMLEALALLHLGQAEPASSLCRQALVTSPLDADLHHALALTQAAAGDVASALASDRKAAWLDADFALPLMHQALLQRGLGRIDASRQAAELALRLLPHESAERIQLFGNGFGRVALLHSCQTLLASPMASEGGPR